MKSNDTTPRVVVFDHFDSFTYNLVVALERLRASVQVLRTNESITKVRREVRRVEPTHVVLSPGPGHPRDVSLFQEVLREFKAHIPILGVCLGHQAIGLHFGAVVDRFGNSPVMHGKTSMIEHESAGIFEGIENPFEVCRYHSLQILESTVDQGVLRITSRSSNERTVMGVQSLEYPHVIGLQFHPESLFTKNGERLLANFLKTERAGVSHGSIPQNRKWE